MTEPIYTPHDVAHTEKSPNKACHGANAAASCFVGAMWAMLFQAFPRNVRNVHRHLGLMSRAFLGTRQSLDLWSTAFSAVLRCFVGRCDMGDILP